ncbi:MAG: transposase [Minisyncoccia bacterium]
MPRRKLPLVEGEYYHIFNRSIDRKPIFIYKKDVLRAIKSLDFYRLAETNKVKFSDFNIWSDEKKQEFLEKFCDKNNHLVEILSYCFMPNHYHFLLRQEKEDGISKFISQFQNSYTRFFNTKYKRKGHIFEGQFKAVRVETEEQLIHLSRYIHLNPYSSFVVKEINDLITYPYSSLMGYLSDKEGKFLNKEIILSHFKNKKAYKKFVFNQADYQRELERIKHLLLE